MATDCLCVRARYNMYSTPTVGSTFASTTDWVCSYARAVLAPTYLLTTGRSTYYCTTPLSLGTVGKYLLQYSYR